MENEKKKNILLTGATGFLGSHLLKAFLKKDWDVSIIKRSFSNTNRIQDCLSRIYFLDIDVDPLELIFEKQGPFDVVVHTATCYGRHDESALQVLHANLLFPLRLLETATFFNTATFYNTASILYPHLNAYALSKQQFEDWGRMLSNKGKIGFTNLKLEHMYGPSDDKSKFTAYIFDNFKKNVPQIELTPGEQKRDFIYIDDVVRAYIVLLENETEKLQFSEYDVGSGCAVSIRNFVEMSKKYSGAKTKLFFGRKKYREHEIMFSQANISALQNIGWNSIVSLQEGICRCL